MFNQTILLAIRKIIKGGFLVWLNITGLAVGLAAVVIIITFIIGELRIGKIQTNHEEIYSIQSSDGANMSYKSISVLKENLPEIAKITSFHNLWGKTILKFNNDQINITRFLVADSSFFKVFQHKSILGDASKALINENSIVLTKKTAEKIFGNNSPLGQRLTIQSSSFGDIELTVNAVIDDPDTKAILDFEGIVGDSQIKKVPWYNSNLEHWGNSNRITFCRLNKQIDKNLITGKINDIIEENAPDWYKQDHKSFSLSNISEQYFNQTDFWGLLKKGNKRKLFTLSVIVAFLLLIAWINFINLATAQQEKLNQLSKLKRSLGASKTSLVLQGTIEVIPTILIALIITFALINIFIPPFNQFTSSVYEFKDVFKKEVLSLILLIIVLTLIICGVIPAVLQKQSPNIKSTKPGTKKQIRGGLFIAQFCISTGLIISTLLILKQNQCMENHPSGFDSESILYLPLRENAKQKAELLGNKLKEHTTITDVTYASDMIGNINQGWGMTLNNNGESKRISYDAMRVSSNFFDFFNLKIVDGSEFMESSEKECHHIFNQTAIRQYGIEDINKARIASYGQANGNIIGTIEDFNFKSFHHPITALGFVKQPISSLNIIYIKLSNNSSRVISESKRLIEKEWRKLEPNWPAEIQFLSQSMNQLYEDDKKFSKLIIIASLLSIIIACIGLLGVCKYIAHERTKEIGIRKVNGAKISEILSMLNKDFIKWVVIAFIIACPIAWYAMNKWLENFAYKTTLSWWVFALAGVLALGIALLTVSFQSWRAATRNPVEALRYE